MSKILNISALIQPVIREVGDLKDIKPFEYAFVNAKYATFKTDSAYLIDVKLLRFDASDRSILDLKLPPAIIKSTNVAYYTISYSMKGFDHHGKPMDLRCLLRIMKTVVAVAIEMLQMNDGKKRDGLVQHIYLILAEDDLGRLKSNKQMSALYYVLISKSLPTGYRMNRHVEVALEPKKVYSAVLVTQA